MGHQRWRSVARWRWGGGVLRPVLRWWEAAKSRKLGQEMPWADAGVKDKCSPTRMTMAQSGLVARHVTTPVDYVNHMFKRP
jgi:hypothetical protein